MEYQSENNLCGFCGKKAPKTCSACKQINYCSLEHQKNDWKNHKKNCKPFTVRKDEKKRPYAITTREISENKIIFKEEPLVIGPRFSEPDPVCVGCLQPVALVNSLKCSKCDWPVCNLKCKELDNHCWECEILSTGKNDIKKNYRFELLLPLRCLLLKKRDNSKWQKILAMANPNFIENITPDTEEYKEAQQIYKYLEKHFSSYLKEEKITRNNFHQIYRIIEANCLEVPYKSTELSALFPTFYYLEHSCLPNVKISFNKFNVEVRSATSIGRNERISAMYTNIIWGTQARLQHLLTTKYILCECTRCKDPTELGTHFSSLKCLQDNCSSYLLPKNSLSMDTTWECINCKTSLPASDANDITSKLTYEVDQILETKYPMVKQVEDYLEKLQSLLHPHHYNCFSIKHTLIQLYGQQQGYFYNQLENTTLNRKISYCNELLLILNKLDNFHTRAPLYLTVIKYELSAAILETMKRRLTETLNLELIQDDAKEAKHLLKQSILLLNNETGSHINYQLIQSCQNLYREVQNLAQGQITDL